MTTTMRNTNYSFPTPTVLSASDFTLDSYLIHVKPIRCSCGKDFQSCEVSEVWINPRATGLTSARRLKPTDHIKPGLQIGYSILPVRTIPVCPDCLTAKQQLQGPVKPLSPEEWAATLKRKYAGEPSAPKVQRASVAPKVPTLDDL